ncbi:DUF72 domain-containing protein [Lyngbya confervoides]|uniref:DUF72 domain-containing protein n=1 Tax=Lyngbya confervoides BDU141951 TaxID=1574623 RepID=A0ABD4T0C8_9CYAN|nr:DUF72 domain-containing protein [Lyngbya confervoides]MCM1982206.1 DUF72 domain-containing protein [Lyngbya confervoides BDU141951]
MTSIHLGCAIWAYRGWLGEFYPADSPVSDLLRLYGNRFSTVECNATFYSVPSPPTVDKWRRTVPEGFLFCPKFPQSISHQGALQPKLPEALDFITLIQGLGDRLGPLFLQLPPRYSPQGLRDLAQFLGGIADAGVRLGLEVRHPLWFEPPHHQALRELLQGLKIGLVLLDTRPIYQGPEDPQHQSQRKKPRLPLRPCTTASFTFIRYISHPQLPKNQALMESWMPPLRQWQAQGQEIFFFMHCPVEEHSPRHAKFFHQLLQSHGIKVPPLPWDQVVAPPAQLDLFAQADPGSGSR